VTKDKGPLVVGVGMLAVTALGLGKKFQDEEQA
jgi:hypothetical protein